MSARLSQRAYPAEESAPLRHRESLDCGSAVACTVWKPKFHWPLATTMRFECGATSAGAIGRLNPRF